jgi:Tol biopolymer transport system component
MNADGSNVVRLTDQHDNWAPRWSPDGRSIAYASRRDGDWDIYRMDADGSDATRLTTGVGWESQPAWSPDGARIAFVRRAPGESLSSIYVMNTDGSNAVRLTYGEQPDWSPDGTMIAFACCSTGTVDIYVMRADGSSVTRLTDSSTYDGSPSWSPDGRRIALVTLVDYGCDWSFCYWYVEPAVMQADGSGLAPLGTIDWSGDAGSVSWRPH